jgi:acetyl-CoA carboxylase biotin carboxyl carrier protein
MAHREILSPLPGTFYRKPAPDAPPFAKEGDVIQAGAVIGLVEVMKTFNQVQADVGGRVVRFMAENEAPVEAGQALLVIDG